MKRKEIRTLKKAVRDQGDSTAMLVLLERSVRLGHKRLSLIRCIQAERLGIDVPSEVLEYCQGVADKLKPEAINRVVMHAQAITDMKH